MLDLEIFHIHLLIISTFPLLLEIDSFDLINFPVDLILTKISSLKSFLFVKILISLNSYFSFY